MSPLLIHPVVNIIFPQGRPTLGYGDKVSQPALHRERADLVMTWASHRAGLFCLNRECCFDCNILRYDLGHHRPIDNEGMSSKSSVSKKCPR